MARHKLSSVFSEALLKAALEFERNPRPGHPIRRRIHKVADVLMARAEEGDMQAVALVFDRLEGKAVQPVDVSTDTRLTVNITGLTLRPDTVIDGTSTHADAESLTYQGDTETYVTGPVQVHADEAMQGAVGTPPPTPDPAQPAQSMQPAVTCVTDADNSTPDPAQDSMDALRARILASLE